MKIITCSIDFKIWVKSNLAFIKDWLVFQLFVYSSPYWIFWWPFDPSIIHVMTNKYIKTLLWIPISAIHCERMQSAVKSQPTPPLNMRFRSGCRALPSWPAITMRTPRLTVASHRYVHSMKVATVHQPLCFYGPKQHSRSCQERRFFSW